jgi:hypothetical protein
VAGNLCTLLIHSHLQMLFYESAACLHGRRQILRGKYYASAFTHYQPVDPKVWHFKTEVGIQSCR